MPVASAIDTPKRREKFLKEGSTEAIKGRGPIQYFEFARSGRNVLAPALM
jgi:hypothetical protein